MGFSKIKHAPVQGFITWVEVYILPDWCGFLKPWTGQKYILPDWCGFYQNFNLGLGGSLNFQTGEGFSEREKKPPVWKYILPPSPRFKNPHQSGSINFHPAQGYKNLDWAEVYTSRLVKIISDCKVSF